MSASIASEWAMANAMAAADDEEGIVRSRMAMAMRVKA